MADRDKHPVDFRELNWLGKTVFLGGAVVRLAANAIDASLDQAARTLAEAERAFYDELDPNIEDAKIIKEESRTGEDGKR